jgi:hypothetical protein
MALNSSNILVHETPNYNNASKLDGSSLNTFNKHATAY